MVMEDFFRNVLLGLSLAAPIGPSSLAVIQNGLKRGFFTAFMTGLGVTTADTTYLLLVYFGLAGAITIPLVKIVIWIFGSLILFFFGIQSIRAASNARLDENAPVSATRKPFIAGYLVNISNPVAVIWWIGIFGSILGSSVSTGNKIQALFSGFAILVGILSWHTSMSLLTHWGRRFLSKRLLQAIAILAGIALIAFGIRFIYLAIQAISLLE
jgi:threonine/homoserine/homoserine lactone efflux protein